MAQSPKTSHLTAANLFDLAVLYVKNPQNSEAADKLRAALTAFLDKHILVGQKFSPEFEEFLPQERVRADDDLVPALISFLKHQFSAHAKENIELRLLTQLYDLAPKKQLSGELAQNWARALFALSQAIEDTYCESQIKKLGKTSDATWKKIFSTKYLDAKELYVLHRQITALKKEDSIKLAKKLARYLDKVEILFCSNNPAENNSAEYVLNTLKSSQMQMDEKVQLIDAELKHAKTIKNYKAAIEQKGKERFPHLLAILDGKDTNTKKIDKFDKEIAARKSIQTEIKKITSQQSLNQDEERCLAILKRNKDSAKSRMDEYGTEIKALDMVSKTKEELKVKLQATDPALTADEARHLKGLLKILSNTTISGKTRMQQYKEKQTQRSYFLDEMTLLGAIFKVKNCESERRDFVVDDNVDFFETSAKRLMKTLTDSTGIREESLKLLQYRITELKADRSISADDMKHLISCASQPYVKANSVHSSIVVPFFLLEQELHCQHLLVQYQQQMAAQNDDSFLREAAQILQDDTRAATERVADFYQHQVELFKAGCQECLQELRSAPITHREEIHIFQNLIAVLEDPRKNCAQRLQSFSAMWEANNNKIAAIKTKPESKIDFFIRMVSGWMKFKVKSREETLHVVTSQSEKINRLRLVSSSASKFSAKAASESQPPMGQAELTPKKKNMRLGDMRREFSVQPAQQAAAPS